MPPRLNEVLTPENALIFRITHRDNVEHVAANGIHCGSAPVANPGFVAIGNDDLIGRRRSRIVSVGPGGALADYIPFYFTPYTPMLYNIKTGYGGIRRRAMSEIVVLVTSLARLEEERIAYVIADRHAFLQHAEFWGDRSRCGELPWEHWRNRDFRRDPNDPAKFERYQAEALVHRYLPVAALLGIGVYDEMSLNDTLAVVASARLTVPVYRRPEWYL